MNKNPTVLDIKNLEPLKGLGARTELFELKKYNRYIIVIKASSIIGGANFSQAQANALAKELKKLEIKAVAIVIDPAALIVYELKGE